MIQDSCVRIASRRRHDLLKDSQVFQLAGFESRIPKRQRGRRDQLHKPRGPFAGLRLARFESGTQVQQNIMNETVWIHIKLAEVAEQNEKMSVTRTAQKISTTFMQI
ncbi:unnamed protein product [Caenorhabditis nigoni]